MAADDRLASRVDRIASVQRGLVTGSQLLEAGLTRRQIGSWVTSGRLERLLPRTYRVTGSPETDEQRLLAVVMAAGPRAAASHRSAAQLWDLVDGPVPPELTVPHPRFPRLPALVHRSRDLTDDAVTVRRGIPVTNPLRTVVDLGAVVDRFLVEEALDRALVSRLLSVPAVDAARARLAKPGRDGTGVMRRVLEERALGVERPDSLLEPLMARLLRRARLPAAVFQHVVSDQDGQFVGKVDFAYPDLRLGIEVDGRKPHKADDAFQHDRTRQNALTLIGWTVLRFTWPDVVRRQRYVAATILNALCALEHRDGA